MKSTVQTLRELKERPESTEASQHRQWWEQYRLARELADSEPPKSCTLFHELSKQEAFPLQDLSWLRAVEACAGSNEKGFAEKKARLDRLANREELKSIAVETALEQARSVGNHSEIARLAFERSKLLLQKHEKLAAMDEALQAAQVLKDKKQIQSFQQRIEMISPSRINSPGYPEYLSVARDFQDERDFKKALQYYWRVLKHSKSGHEEKYQALRGIREVFRLQRQTHKEAYLQATRDLADFVERRFSNRRTRRTWTERYHDQQVQLARTIWTENSRKDAEEILARLEARLKGQRSLGLVFWLRGRMAEEAGRLEEAIRWLEHAEKESRLPRELFEDILWAQAWILKKLNRNQEAVAAFQKLTDMGQVAEQLPRYRFWKAKLLSDLKKIDEAHKEYELLIEEDPVGYYGLLAYRELGKPIPALKTPRQSSQFQISKSLLRHLEKEEILYVEWLIAVDENEIARRILDQIALRLRQRKIEDPELWQEIFSYYARAGEYLGLFVQLGYLEPQFRSRFLKDHPHLLFPRPYQDVVDQASDTRGVSSELIYSIMRQESAFNPFARSVADAFGLMQLLPSVARSSGESIGIHFARDEDLFRPEVNIPLGANHIKGLLDRFDNQFILAVASYNASESAILNWVKTRFDGDPLSFIEDVPYRETQTYIKLVLRNFVFYQRLESEEPTIVFPEECLTSLHNFKS